MWDGWDVVRTGQVKQEGLCGPRARQAKLSQIEMSGELRTRKLPRLMGKSGQRPPNQAKQQPKKPPKQNTKTELAHQPGETKNLVKHAPDYCKTSLQCMGRLRNTERQCKGSECSQDQASSMNMVASKRKAGGPRRLPKHHIEKTQWSPTWNVNPLAVLWPNISGTPLDCVGCSPSICFTCNNCIGSGPTISLNTSRHTAYFLSHAHASSS